VETVVSSLGDLAEGTSGTELGELSLLGSWVSKVLSKTLLQCDGVGDEEISGVVLVDPGLDLGEPAVQRASDAEIGAVGSQGTHHLFFLRM
jgi:hypothetical protein